MSVELKIPSMGESITSVQIGQWAKKEGDRVERDEVIVELETDKAAMELPSPCAGVLIKQLKKEGDSVSVGEAVALIEESAAKPLAEARSAPVGAKTSPSKSDSSKGPNSKDSVVMPAARRELAQRGLAAHEVPASGPGGRLLKEDVQKIKSAAPSSNDEPARAPLASRPVASASDEEIVPMSPIRLKIAERLVQAQQTAALLTTFNEIDMTEVIAMRGQHRESFEQKHGVKLGFMSFFVKAAVDALKSFPSVNAEIRGHDIVYRNVYDVGVAVGGGKGLVVPVIRQAERLGFAEIEKIIADYAERARANKLTLKDLEGGTFTISNGGIYGSLLSTPIVNPPQSAILGLHAIQERPVAREGQVVIRSMMYVALTYDHRLIDGREAVSFLRRVKDVIESPARLLLEI